MPTRSRIEPCEILRQDHIASTLWLEDAIVNYNVPTCVFDLFLLVSDPDAAARSLCSAGWTEVETETDIQRCPFAAPPHSIHHVCLEPPLTTEERQDDVPEDDAAPATNGPTRTVLLSARDCHTSLESLSPDDDFIPPLDFLIDGLIAGVLDAEPESKLERRLYIQLAYLYGHCEDTRSAHLIGQLRHENRQFHIDALTGPSVGKSPLIAWNRRVRGELLDGKRQIMYENSLLAANPPEYETFIFYTRSEYRPLPKTMLSAISTGLPDT